MRREICSGCYALSVTACHPNSLLRTMHPGLHEVPSCWEAAMDSEGNRYTTRQLLADEDRTFTEDGWSHLEKTVVSEDCRMAGEYDKLSALREL